MPDVTISDDLSDTGTINVYPEGSIVRVTGTHIGIDVLTETSQVRVFGESYFFRIKIRWNGGASPAQVLDITPSGLLVDCRVEIHNNISPYEWAISYRTLGGQTVRDEVSITPTPGNLLQQITYTGYADGIVWTDIGFITKDSNGTPIYPDDGDVCWIEVGPGNF